MQCRFLQYFRPSLSYHLSLRYLFCQFKVAVLRRILLYKYPHFWYLSHYAKNDSFKCQILRYSGGTGGLKCDLRPGHRIPLGDTLTEYYSCLLYDWRESCLLICPICLHKSLCLPENWEGDIGWNPAQTNFQKLIFLILLQYHPLES